MSQAKIDWTKYDDSWDQNNGTLNFDYAHVYCDYNGEHCNSRKIAMGISNYLVARASYAVLSEGQEWCQDETYQLSGLMSNFQTQDHQWHALAGMMANYGSYLYDNLWIGLLEYRVLQTV